MKKRMICLLLILVCILSLVGCATKPVTCDHCGKEVQVQSNSKVTNDWIVYCRTCELELFGEDGVIS